VSHIATRIVANALTHPTRGVNAIAARMPLDDGDATPPLVTVYDETRDGWLLAGQVPVQDSGISFPCITVTIQKALTDGGPADTQSTGARTVDGSVSLIVQLLFQDSNLNRAAAAGMYVMRAIRNSLVWLDENDNDAARTLLGFRLMPASTVPQGQAETPPGDNMISIGAFALVYDTVETTDLT
jgi:hypothetical protein